MTDTVIYARVSSKEQEREGYSIDAQLRLLREYAQKNEFTILHEFVEVETAKKTGRPQLANLLEFIRNTPDCRTLLVEKTDRLYRNLKDWVTLDDLQIDIHFVKEGTVIGPNAKSSEKLLHGIKVVIAKNYIENLAEEALKGMNEKAISGGWPAKAPWGYRNNRELHTIEPDPDEVEAVQWLFRMYAEGEWSIKQVIRMFYDCGYSYRSNRRKLHPATLHRILQNPIYIGEIHWNGLMFKGSHPAIIDDTTWMKVQKALTDKGKIKKSKHRFAYKGLMTCGHCGATITAELQKGKYTYYRCSQGHGECKENGYVKDEVLDKAFLKALRALHISDEMAKLVMAGIKQVHQAENDQRKAEVTQLRRQKTELDAKVQATYNDHLNGEISHDFWKEHHIRLINERRLVQASIDRYDYASEEFYECAERILLLAREAETIFVEVDKETRRKLLGMVLLNCTLTSGKPHYSYKKPFAELVEGSKTASWQP